MRGRRRGGSFMSIFNCESNETYNFCEKKPPKLEIEMKKLNFLVSSSMDVDQPKFSSNLIELCKKIAKQSLNTQIDSGVYKKQVITVKRGSFVLI